MARSFKKKVPFSELDQEFKDTISNMTDVEIRNKLAEITLNDHENRMAKKQDVDLAEKVAAAKFAGEGYREAAKMNRLKVSYAHFILEARGKA